MQVSQITPVLLAVLSLATPQPAASQGGNRYRVNVDNAWFYQDVAGRRIARLARRLGYRSVTLGCATERHWEALRVILECEDTPDLVLADAVDVLLRWECDPDLVEA